jgi:hypothetical protein
LKYLKKPSKVRLLVIDTISAMRARRVGQAPAAADATRSRSM